MRQCFDQQGIVEAFLDAIGNDDLIARRVFATRQNGTILENRHRGAIDALGGLRGGCRPSESVTDHELGEILLDCGLFFGCRLVAIGLKFTDAGGELLGPDRILFTRDLKEGFEGAIGVGHLGVDAGLFDIIEERDQAVEILLGDRVKLVVVAAGAAHGEAQPDGAGGLHPIDRIFQEVLLSDGAAFVTGHMVSVKTTGDQLFDGRIREKIARKLFNGELIERHVLAECV